MQIKVLGETVSATSALAQTAVTNTTTPFAPPREAVVILSTNGLTGSPVIAVQQSNDGTTYSDEFTVTAQGPVTVKQIKLKKYTRLNVTTAATAGTVSAHVVKDDA